jgi:hypothetical protein
MINARDQRAAARDARQQQGAALVAGVAALAVDEEDEGQVPAPVPVRGAAAAAAAPLVMDPGLWLNMVNVKPPQLSDLELESMKKFILDYKRYSQKCPEQLRRKMQHFILEDHLDIIVEFGLHDRDEIMDQDRDDFIVTMLEMHHANSSRKWRLMMKNAKMEKSDLSLSTYSQYVEDFKFWMKAAGDNHKPPEKEIVKIFVNGLKPDIFKEEIYSRACENMRGVINEAREELATYREVLDISDRMKKSEVSRAPSGLQSSDKKKAEKPGKPNSGASMASRLLLLCEICFV